MNCPLTSKERDAALDAVVLEYCAGRLGAERAAEFERHAQHCDACAAMVAAQRELWERLDRWDHAGLPEVSPDFDARLYARIAHEQAAPAWRKWLRGIMPATPGGIWKPAVSMAAAGAVLAIGLWTAGFLDLTMGRAPRPVQNAGQMEADHVDTHVDIEQVANALDELDLLMPVSHGTPASHVMPAPLPSPRVM